MKTLVTVDSVVDMLLCLMCNFCLQDVFEMKYAKIPEDCLMNFSDSEMLSGEDESTSESESSSDSEEEREKRLKELQEQVCTLQFVPILNWYWRKMMRGFAQTPENTQITL